MKPAVWRIFQNGRWSYSDQPSTRHQDRPAWQPLYAQPQREWQGLTTDELIDCEKAAKGNYFDLLDEHEAKLKAKNHD